MLRSSRVIGVAAAMVGAGVLSIAPAAATAPRAGATYKGPIATAASSEGTVSFTVSKDGKTVTHLRVGPYPLNTCGSGGAPPHQSSKPAAIHDGKFTGHVAYSGGGNVFAKATVTGKFLRKGKEKGVVTTVILGNSQCGQSLPYATHVK